MTSPLKHSHHRRVVLSAIPTEGEFAAGLCRGLFGLSRQSAPLAHCSGTLHTLLGFFLGTRSSANLQIRERPRKKSYSEIQAKAIKVGSPVKKKKGEDKGQALADTSGEARRMMLQEKCYVSWARGFRPHSQKQGEHPWVIWWSHLISNWDQPLLQSLQLLLHVCFLPWWPTYTRQQESCCHTKYPTISYPYYQ